MEIVAAPATRSMGGAQSVTAAEAQAGAALPDADLLQEGGVVLATLLRLDHEGYVDSPRRVAAGVLLCCPAKVVNNFPANGGERGWRRLSCVQEAAARVLPR